MCKRKLPSYPLFVKDPNFSIWSNTERLNGENTATWFGEQKKIYGFLRVERETYCFMGDGRDFAANGVKMAEQVSLNVSAFFTDYEFEAGAARLKLRFVSPLPLNDLSLLSLPVCYMEYEIEGVSEAEISLFVNRAIAYNDIAETQDKSVIGGVIPLSGCEAAFTGLSRQLPLSNTVDAIGADWGYWYLSGESAYLLDDSDMKCYLETGDRAFTFASEDKYVGSINGGLKGLVMLGYDDVVSIDYFGDFLKGYYLETNTIVDALEYVFRNYARIDEELFRYDEKLRRSVAYLGEKTAEEYYNVLAASLRQSIAAHKLVKDKNGNVLFLSKENHSNGCIATVDVSYPSMPLFLLENTELVKGMLRPIFKFAEMPVWKYDFAPHDAGTYPACRGQIYSARTEGDRYCGNYLSGNTVKTNFPLYLLPPQFDAYMLESQMPVEECANVLVMLYACYYYDRDISFFKSVANNATKWAEYLVKYGLKPEDQLCTDDFAGHLKNNLNLAIKATVGIACYAELLKAAGECAAAKEYRKTAEKFAAEITECSQKYGHLPLTWDSDGTTYSLKYNFAFDKILGLRLFKQELFESEVDLYLEKMNRYGTPLDNRKEYTKSDWLLWVASLTDSVEKKSRLIGALNNYLTESKTRVPFGDWYESAQGTYIEFCARSVQGGCFILLLNS